MSAMPGSRLSRARGSKPDYLGEHLREAAVAPFTGAWIETCDPVRRLADRQVAPFTGAWIETPAGAGRSC